MGADQDIVCIDSPGLFDSNGAEEEDDLMSKIASSMKNKPVSLFCFVVKQGVFSAEQMVTIRRIRHMFSQDKADWDRFCFIVTHADFVGSSKDKNKAFREQTAAEAATFANKVREQFAE